MFQHPEGTEEGSDCNREVLVSDQVDGSTTTRCEGTMVLKVKDLGPGNEYVYLECSECLARWPE